MGTIQSAIRIRDGMSSALQSMNRSLRIVLSSFEAMQRTSANPVNTVAIRSAQRELDQVSLSIREMETEMERANQTSTRMGNGFHQANSGASRLLTTVRNLASAYVGLQGIETIVNLSDSMASTTARLDLMNDGLQSTEQLQKKIFQSAQNSRSAYLETAAAISKMGLNAGNAFTSNDELIAFMEQVNKNFVIGGASAEEQKNAMLQLTQAMGAGALRGEELNSILEQGPLIARNIEKYMGWASGSIKSYAADGMVTAEVVKNAMLAMAEETNNKFDGMNRTWAQVMTNIQNRALMASQGLLSMINLIAQHWGSIEPVAIAAGVGILFFSTATWVACGGVGTLTGAIGVLWSTLIKNPFILLASLILGVVVYAIYQWIQACGDVETAWATAMYNAETITNNVMNAIFYKIQDTVNGAIKLINMLIRGANQIPGVNFKELETVHFADKRAAEGARAVAAARTRMETSKATAAEKKTTGMAQLHYTVADSASLSGIGDSTEKIARNTGSALDSLNRTAEDLSYMRELAGQKSISQFTTAEIKVDMSGMTNQINSEMDLDGVVAYLENRVEESMLVAAEGIHL